MTIFPFLESLLAKFKLLIAFIWSAEIFIGVLKRIQMTLSSKGGVVKDPSYVQMSLFSAGKKLSQSMAATSKVKESRRYFDAVLYPLYLWQVFPVHTLVFLFTFELGRTGMTNSVMPVLHFSTLKTTKDFKKCQFI